MATCIHCQASSQFLTYDALGLCHHCSPQHAPVIAGAIAGIAAEAGDRHRQLVAEKQLASLETSIAHCKVLLRYPALSVEGAKADELMNELRGLVTEALENGIRHHWLSARELAGDYRGVGEKVDVYAKGISRVQDLASFVEDATLVTKAVTVMRAERDAIVFEVLFKKAQLAEAKGNKKRAKELYIEAEFALKKDATPDAHQSELIDYAEKQIERLGGRPKPGSA